MRLVSAAPLATSSARDLQQTIEQVRRRAVMALADFYAAGLAPADPILREEAEMRLLEAWAQECAARVCLTRLEGRDAPRQVYGQDFVVWLTSLP
ncbi:MAG: hypothetical protein JF617_08645 [Burkholderiales bacterium]|nr:hypothetical protein [Burkholderiales bacterium]